MKMNILRPFQVCTMPLSSCNVCGMALSLHWAQAYNASAKSCKHCHMANLSLSPWTKRITSKTKWGAYLICPSVLGLLLVLKDEISYQVEHSVLIDWFETGLLSFWYLKDIHIHCNRGKVNVTQVAGSAMETLETTELISPINLNWTPLWIWVILYPLATGSLVLVY